MNNHVFIAKASHETEWSGLRARDKKRAENLVPWAWKLVAVQGGWLAFHDSEEYRVWKQQR